MTKSVNSLLLTRIETWHATEQKPLPEGFFPRLARGSTEGTESGPVLQSNLHSGPSSGLPPTETFAKRNLNRKSPQLALVQTEKRKNGMVCNGKLSMSQTNPFAGTECERIAERSSSQLARVRTDERKNGMVSDIFDHLSIDIPGMADGCRDNLQGVERAPEQLTISIRFSSSTVGIAL
jgi:hypothetical protein